MNKVIVETSARHIHVSKEALEALFGAGYELTKKKDLSQPGQYACEEKLVVVGPKGSIKASILGPTACTLTRSIPSRAWTSRA